MIQNQEQFTEELVSIQCCYQNLVNALANSESIGQDCIKKEKQMKKLYAYILTLQRHNVEETSCLTNAEVNIILEKVKIICNNCCSQLIEI